jgi:predicted nucleic acid-binding protein
MLDTNSCIYVMKRHPPAVQERLRRVAVGEVGISVKRSEKGIDVTRDRALRG